MEASQRLVKRFAGAAERSNILQLDARVYDEGNGQRRL